jgi:transposase InsO family protein
LGYSRDWFYKWLNRYRTGDEKWFKEQSRRPIQNPNRTPQEIEELVQYIRLDLYNEGLFCGAQAIQWEMEDQGIKPLPSQRTIARILARRELTHRRTGRYEPKGVKYPQWPAQTPGAVHQSDYLGPCYLHGPPAVRFHGLNSVDLATGRCATEPVFSKARQNTINAFWASWLRLGLPKVQQVDNEMVFYGSPAHPRGMGQLIRLCLLHGVEPCFIPISEPWRNGVVEKFNHHWLQGLLRKVTMHSQEDLKRESLLFEQKHNSRYRYSKLGGKTPLQRLSASQATLRFPPTERAPRHPLPKPTEGRYHLIRFIRSDAKLDIFGEAFIVPSEAVYEYVRATIDVSRQTLSIYLDNSPIEELKYEMN